MASPLQDITRGVIDPANNFALDSLSRLLGTELVFGGQLASTGAPITASANNNNTLLLLISSSLSPVYLAALLLILAWIGIGGTAKTALDGEFLGRNWNSFGVPFSVLLAIVMLAPVPKQNNITLTLSQVAFVRVVQWGSNFGDYVLRAAVNGRQQQAINTQQGTAQAARFTTLGIMDQTSTRMAAYLPNIVCAEQMVASGVSKQFTFFNSLNMVCGVPAGMQGLYADSFSYGDYPANAPYDESTGRIVGTRQRLSPPPVQYNNDSAKEYKCYYDALSSTYANASGIPNNILAGLGLPALPGITFATAGQSTMFSNEGQPTGVVLPGNQIKLRDDQIIAGWTTAVQKAATCLQTPPTRIGSNPAFTSAVTGLPIQPYEFGWGKAAAMAKDAIEGKTGVEPEPLSFASSEISPPNMAPITKTQGGPILRAKITALTAQLSGLTPKLKLVMDSVSKDAMEDAINSTTPGIVVGNTTTTALTDTARQVSVIGNTGMIGSYLLNPNAAQATRLGRQTASAMGTSGVKFLNSFGSYAKMARNTAQASLGGSLAALRGFSNYIIRGINTTMQVQDGKKGIIESLRSIPLVGAAVGIGATVVSGAAKLALGAFAMPGIPTALVLMMTALNVMTLAPEMAITLALILWLLRVTAWFLMVPISTVLMALPNTNVGHNVWKEALALALTPAITMLFFVVSLLMYDVVIDVSVLALFEPYMRDTGGNTMRLLGDILSGEAIYRIAGLVLTLMAGFTFCIGLILRGPGWALRTMGLTNPNHDEFAGEANQLEQGSLRSIRKGW